MADIVGEGSGEVSFFVAGEGWVSLGTGSWELTTQGDVTEPNISTDEFAKECRRICGALRKKTITVSVSFAFVGQSLPYPRRRQMLDLARYARWPYTN